MSRSVGRRETAAALDWLKNNFLEANWNLGHSFRLLPIREIPQGLGTEGAFQV